MRKKQHLRSALQCWATRARAFGIVGAAGLALLTTSALSAVPPDWAQKWRHDLDFVAVKIREIHPSPFTKVDESAFDAALDDLERRLPTLDHHQVVTELAAAVALIGDGHTRLTLPLAEGVEFFQGHSPTPSPTIDGLRFHALPIRVAMIGDELFVRAASPQHRAVLGARIVRLGAMSVAEAIAAVAPTVRRDNDLQLRHLLPTHLVLAEVLEARGVARSTGELHLEVELRDGERRRVTLRPQRAGAEPLVSAGSERNDGAPLWLRDPETPYWFEWLQDSTVLYFQFNQVGGAEGERLDEFTARLMAELDQREDPTLVIDLRHNPGGWYGTAKPLLRALLRREIAERPGRLIVLTGRTTFSAAMMLAVDLERHTNALFLGEPTGSSPNHHGDARRLLLPESGLTLRVSTLYWQSHPSDQRDAIEPHVRIEPTFDDYLEGRDPVLEAAFAIARKQKATAGADGDWSGRMSFPQSAGVPFSLHIDEQSGGHRAQLSVPDFGVENLELEQVEWGRGSFHGQAPWKGGNVTRVLLDAELRDGYLVGIASLAAEMGTERLPFVLRRAAPQVGRGSGPLREQ